MKVLVPIKEQIRSRASDLRQSFERLPDEEASRKSGILDQDMVLFDSLHGDTMDELFQSAHQAKKAVRAESQKQVSLTIGLGLAAGASILLLKKFPLGAVAGCVGFGAAAAVVGTKAAAYSSQEAIQDKTMLRLERWDRYFEARTESDEALTAQVLKSAGEDAPDATDVLFDENTISVGDFSLQMGD